jgi:hypothetical protein
VPGVTPFRSFVQFSLILAALMFAAPAGAQRGALTVPRNLEQLTDRAADIVRGTVLSARVERHPDLGNLDTLVVKLRVSDAIKGTASGTFTFRQYIWDIRDRTDAAGYLKGREYVLLLNASSRYGLTSPAGMEQGRFRILRDAEGRQMAINGRGNVSLLRGVDSSLAQKGTPLSPTSSRLVEKHQGGPIAVDDLVRLLRELVVNQD